VDVDDAAVMLTNEGDCVVVARRNAVSKLAGVAN
jgi:hypothetical protein